MSAKALKAISVIAVVASAAFVLWRLLAPSVWQEPRLYKDRKELMGTVVEIQAYGRNPAPAVREAFAEIARLSDLLSIFNPRSEVTLINGMAGIAKVAVSHDTFDAIQRSIKLSRTLSGSFDITVGPLTDLWRVNEPGFEPPSRSSVKEALSFVGYKRVELDDELETVKLPRRGMKLDLGGVGKGYCLSRARNILLRRGIRSALLSCGSSMTCIGNKPDGSHWKIGIKSPRDEGKIIGIIELRPGQALSTSGDYEKFAEAGGKRYHHIIDPRSGFPAEGCESVTVTTDDATLADALSTAAFVSGPENGLRLIKRQSNSEGLIVDSKGKVRMTSGLSFSPIGEEKEK